MGQEPSLLNSSIFQVGNEPERLMVSQIASGRTLSFHQPLLETDLYFYLEYDLEWFTTAA